MLLMFICICKVIIGNVVFDYAADIAIDYSFDQVVQTCRILQPRRAKFNDADVNQKIKAGDRVTVQIGYRNDFGSANLGLRTEFVGYVADEGINTPVEFRCEDEMYNLKVGSINKDYPNGVSLKQLIADVAPGYQYDIDDIQLGAWRIENASPVQVFQDLMNQGIYVYFVPPTAVPYRGQGNYVPVLRAGRKYRPVYRRVLLASQRNTFNPQLTWHTEDKGRIVIKAVSNIKGGGKLVYYYPEGADRSKANIYSRNFPKVSMPALKRLAEEEYNKFVREGYVGSTNSLGTPLITMGDEARIENPEYPANNGDYIIDAVYTQFGDNGFKRRSVLGGLTRKITRA